ncbi:unnamed protein product [Periconia digitata]|uniref:F-box domain-containing protein n=1 Tax=Periconia digitata TaxID=1303443 RepID=A0A9W4XSD7_9PLEO|nr:unnamed protein product [Periconia digitata]
MMNDELTSTTTTSKTSVSGLESLPDEILLSIVEIIDDPDDETGGVAKPLLALTQTCIRLRSIARAEHYAVVFIHDARDVIRLYRWFEDNPEDWLLVRRLVCYWREVSQASIRKGFAYLLSQMKNLQSLSLGIYGRKGPHPRKIPIDQRFRDRFGAYELAYSTDQVEAVPPTLPPVEERRCMIETCFEMLEKVNDPSTTEEYLLDLNSMEYQGSYLPSPVLNAVLGSRTLTCMMFYDTFIPIDSVSSEFQFTSPLQTLELINCKMNQSTLTTLLARPKALRKLSVLEGFRKGEDPNEVYWSKSLTVFVSAVEQQSHSLELLSHDIDMRYQEYENIPTGNATKGFSNFYNLRTLELHHLSALRSCISKEGFAPPSLRKYTIEEDLWNCDANKVFKHIMAALEEAIGLTRSKSLKTLDMSLLSISVSPSEVEQEWSQKAFKLVQALNRLGVSVRIEDSEKHELIDWKDDLDWKKCFLGH